MKKTTTKKQKPQQVRELAKKLTIKENFKIFERSGLKIDIDESGDVMFNQYGNDELIIGFLLLQSAKNENLDIFLKKIAFHYSIAKVDEILEKHSLKPTFGKLGKNK